MSLRIPTGWQPFLALILLCTCVTPSGASAGAGTRAFEFLRLPAEPVGRSLAGAHLAVAEGAACLAWNPAGLGQDCGAALLLSHATWTAETSWQWGAFTVPLSARSGALGFSLGFFRAGHLEGFDAAGQPTGSFAPLQATATVAYGRPLGEKLSVGVCAELALDRAVEGEEQTAWAGGGGVQWRSGRLSLGAAALHLAPDVAIGDERFPLPMTVRGGGTLRAGRGMRLHAAAEWVAEESPKLLAGWEWMPAAGVSALAGLAHDPDYSNQTILPTYGLRLGVGQLQFAYGYQPARTLNASHQLSISLALARSR